MKKALCVGLILAMLIGCFPGVFPASAAANDLILTNCTPRGDSTTQDEKGAWSRTGNGLLLFANDNVIGGGQAITASMQSGTLRGLHYVLDKAVDISNYSYFTFEMRHWADASGGASSNWAEIAKAYAKTIRVVLGTGEGHTANTLSFGLEDITFRPDSKNPTLFHVTVALKDGTGSGSFQLKSIRSFHFFTNTADGPAMGGNELTANLRLDNLRATNDKPATEQPGGGVTVVEDKTWDISGSKEHTHSGTGNVTWMLKDFQIDAGKFPLNSLDLLVSLYVENLDAPGDLSGFTKDNLHGQIELTSSGTSDVAEYSWSLPKQGLRAGWNYLRLPLSAATAANGGADLAKLNFFRLYNLVPEGNTTRFEVKIRDVKLTTVKEKQALPSFLADGMLFQQNQPMSLWGRANAKGDKVEAVLSKGSATVETKTVTAGADGNWSLAFSARKGGYDAYTITVKVNGVTVKTLRDVLVGELWLAAGQSNMEFTVNQCVGGSELIAGAKDKYLRVLLEPSIPAGRYSDQPKTPEWDIPGAKWGYGDTAGEVGNISAVAYSMALKLRKELNVPVGILNTALGATVIETWMSRESIEGNAAVKKGLTDRGIYKTLENFNSAADKWNQMTAMYNAKIAPLKGMKIAGVIWYQGESNAKYAYGFYAEALRTMVEDWSNLFGFKKGEMPFLITHLAPHAYTTSMPFDYTAYMAEMMAEVCQTAKAKMAQITIYDLPLVYRDPPVSGYHPIHPSTKIPVGERLAAAALSLVYGKGGADSAPAYSSMKVVGDRIQITFSDVGNGLKLPAGAGKAVHGFAICGSDRVFVGASARIVSKNTVEVWNDGISKPVAVTYGFATFNMGANLYNSANLPAVPFRTDKVKSVYTTPNDWTYCDSAQVWTANAAKPEAGFAATWAAAPITGGTAPTIAFDTGKRAEGLASLKLTYTAKKTGVGPVLDHPYMVNQLAGYTGLAVSVANGDARGKTLLLKLKTSDGSVYTAAAVTGKQKAASHTLSKSKDFAVYTFDLQNLSDSTGKAVSSPKGVLAKVKHLEFAIEDTAGGTVYLDDIRFTTGALAFEDSAKEPGYEDTGSLPGPSGGETTKPGTLPEGTTPGSGATDTIPGGTTAAPLPGDPDQGNNGGTDSDPDTDTGTTAPVGGDSQTPGAETPDGGSATLWWILGIVAVCVLAGGGVLLFLARKKAGK